MNKKCADNKADRRYEQCPGFGSYCRIRDKKRPCGRFFICLSRGAAYL